MQRGPISWVPFPRPDSKFVVTREPGDQSNLLPALAGNDSVGVSVAVVANSARARVRAGDDRVFSKTAWIAGIEADGLRGIIALELRPRIGGNVRERTIDHFCGAAADSGVDACVSDDRQSLRRHDLHGRDAEHVVRKRRV